MHIRVNSTDDTLCNRTLTNLKLNEELIPNKKRLILQKIQESEKFKYKYIVTRMLSSYIFILFCFVFFLNNNIHNM